MPLRSAMGVGLNIQQRTFAKHSSKYPAPHGTPDTWLCVQWGAGVALASPATSNLYHLESYWHTAEQHKEPDSHVLVD